MNRRETSVAVAGTLLMWVFFVPATVVFTFLAACGREGMARWAARSWSRFALLITGAKVEVVGAGHLEPDRPYILVANHQSVFDIPAIMAHFPVPFRWVARKGLFRIPVFGRGMRSIGSISVDRNDPRSAIRSFNRALAEMRPGDSILVFPEGTRTPDGRVHEFKSGAFILAEKSGFPVVPIAIVGTDRLQPKGSFSVRPGRVKIVITRPIAADAMKRQDLARHARERIISVRDRYGDHYRNLDLPA